MHFMPTEPLTLAIFAALRSFSENIAPEKTNLFPALLGMK
jgi:hypothetical protein